MLQHHLLLEKALWALSLAEYSSLLDLVWAHRQFDYGLYHYREQLM